MSTRTIAARAATAYAVRGVIAASLGAGLVSVAGSEAPAIGTIAATCILVAIILAGVAMTWLGSLARLSSHPGGWVTAQGAVVLLVGVIAPVAMFPHPLIDTPGVVWLLAAVMLVSGAIELAGRPIGRASVAAGTSQILAALLLAATIWITDEPYLLSHLAPVGIVLTAHAVSLGAASYLAARG